MTTPSAGGPLPLKPGESPEDRSLLLASGILAAHVLTLLDAEKLDAVSMNEAVCAALKAYGDRRGEEERAKALEILHSVVPLLCDAGSLVAGTASQCSDPGRHDAFCRCHAADVGRKLVALVTAFQQLAPAVAGPLAAAPSGDAKGAK